MTRKRRPSKALLRDIEAVFEKHNWPGTAVGIVAEAAAPPPASNKAGCPPGTVPHDITVKDPQTGKWVTVTVCV